MIILPCLPFALTGGYVTSIFLLMFAFGLLFKLIRG